MEKLEWDEIEPVAERIFSVWTDQPELRWARTAWKYLEQARLTQHGDEDVDLVKVYVRLLALGMIYHNWCCAAFDEGKDPDPAYWIEDPPIEDWDYQIGRLVGQIAETPEDGTTIEEGTIMLASEERSKILEALLVGFGGESGLFLELWRSNQNPDFVVSSSAELEDDEDVREVETDEMVLNDVTIEKLQGFLWISNGCPP